ncbi:CNH-domain-containing protein [Mycena metata]|uniref:CNH-domain-containing protein n=1 Tax=Mycena metata TaxID=1033252 RepID=A0AAD7HKS0_9AGAR|nr:CNH-domain-containing protein [Mycena metata]
MLTFLRSLEAPRSRADSMISAAPHPAPPAQYAQFAQRYPQPGHRFSSASDTPPTSIRSSVASSSTSPTSFDHDPSPSSATAGAHLNTTTASRRSSETARTLPRLAGPRRERTAQDRALSMSTPGSPTAPSLPGVSPLGPHAHAHPPSGVHANSSSSTVAAGSGSATPKPKRSAAPIVYPALLSRVADAFRQRVPRADRVKDGLTYHDAFDGREAVDRIAHIIKTTDRNLALLLGRALDAQKFFHDVTYDHRLRDSVVELYQFRTKLPSPFGSGELAAGAVGAIAGAGGEGVSTPDLVDGAGEKPGEVLQGEAEEEAPLPSGVFTLLADCYSPTCSRDQLCYSIACPRRLEQQARLNMKPQPGLTKEAREALDPAEPEPDAGALWIHSVPAEIVASVSDAEKKRQEAINEVIYTERDFVRDMEYLRDAWVAKLAVADIIPQERREQFLIQVFWNAHDIITVNTKLRDALNKRQRAYAVVEKIGDIFLDAVPYFEPFVSYGAHQLYGKYEFEKEKSANPAFAAFVETTERLPESRKLELNAYLTKPTTRLARYPLLLEAVLKHTPDDSPDKLILPKVVAEVRAFLSRVNEESGRSENRFNLAQLDSQLLFKPGEQVDLRLQEDGRELVYKGPLNKRDGELQVYLFDHALLFAKPLKTKTHDQFRVYRRPIPLELLLISASEEPNNNKDTLRGQRTRQLVRKSSFGSTAPRGSPHPPAVNIRPDAKGPHWITFAHLGRKTYSLVLWANSALAQRKWVESITKQQTAMRERSMVFDTVALSEGFFGANKVNCAAPFSGGRRIVYGTDDGVYISDLRDISKDPVKVLALLDVSQVDVLEDYQLLIVLAERQVLTFPLDALDPMDPMAGLKRAKRIATHTSFFKAGFCLGRVLVCIVKSTQLSSTFKALEPIEQTVRGRAKPTFKKLLQGGNDTLKPFREFYIPVESTSIHYLKTRMCIGCSKGFEIVDLESLETQGLLDPADESLEFVRKRENLRPMAIYRVNNDFLLCYDEFAFYVNKTGRRSRKEFMVFWEGTPTGFALHEPYVLAFEPSFVEIRHIETGLMSQVIQGSNLRLLFADTPPSVNNSGGGYNYQGGYDPYSPPNSANSRGSAYTGYGMPPPPPHMQHPNQYPHQQHRYPQGVGRDEILMVSDDRVLALRTAAGPQRFMSDNVSMMSMPR